MQGTPEVHAIIERGFSPFSTQHAIALLGFGGAMALAIVLGFRHRDTSKEATARAWGVRAMWVFIAAYMTYYLWPTRFDLKISLPLQLCDLALIAAPIALGNRARWARTLLYFWGLLLSSQGFISPTLDVGADHPRYWLFWISHAIIVGSGLYEVIVLRYRPAFKDLCVAVGASVAYALAVFELDRRMGFNYGFVGESSPGAPTIVDHLGPWPLRVVWMAVIGITFQTLAWAAWPLCAKLKKPVPPTGGESDPHAPR